MTRRSAKVMFLALVAFGTGEVAAQASAPSYLDDLDSYTHLETIARSDGERVRDFRIPLGAIEKIRGVWAPRDAERVTGLRQTYTWRVIDGFSSEELVTELDERLADSDGIHLDFACEARACGSSVQWANRVFGQRLLYGTEVSQRYRVYTLESDSGTYRLLIYGSARTADRQYLHGELITVEGTH